MDDFNVFYDKEEDIRYKHDVATLLLLYETMDRQS